MKIEKNKDIIEDAEYGLDSRFKSSKEHESESTLLMEARLLRMKNLSKDQIIRAKLMQLKLKMEEYLKQPIYDNKNHFLDFLKSYIDTIYSTRNGFAHDINIKPIRLSQVINKHREPSEEFILKLMIHSEKVYESISGFQKKNWFDVYFQEKICETMSKQDKWRPNLEKEVSLSESIK